MVSPEFPEFPYVCGNRDFLKPEARGDNAFLRTIMGLKVPKAVAAS
jgi:acetoacetate decarboxylase